MYSTFGEYLTMIGQDVLNIGANILGVIGHIIDMGANTPGPGGHGAYPPGQYPLA